MSEQVNEWIVEYDDDDESYEITQENADGTRSLIATVHTTELMYLFSASRGLLEACRLLIEAVCVDDEDMSVHVQNYATLLKAACYSISAYNSATRSKA